MPKKTTAKKPAETTEKVEKTVAAAPAEETKPAKAPAAPKAAKACKETVKCTIEFGGKNTSVEAIVEAVKEAYAAEGNKAAIKTIELYVQPENGVAYYVINGVSEGKCINF